MTSVNGLRIGGGLGFAAAWLICSLAGGCGQPVVSAKVTPTKVTLGVSLGKSSPAATAPSNSGATTEQPADDSAAKPADATSDFAGSNGSPADATSQPPAASGNGANNPPELAKERKFKVEGPDGALRITYDDLDVKKLLNYDNVIPGTDEKLPSWVKALNGKTIRLRGYMKPGFQSEDITQFVLARDTGACCFGPKPRIDYLILVELAPGKTTPLLPLRPFDVVGKFRIELSQLDDGTIYSLYFIDQATLIDK